MNSELKFLLSDTENGKLSEDIERVISGEPVSKTVIKAPIQKLKTSENKGYTKPNKNGILPAENQDSSSF